MPLYAGPNNTSNFKFEEFICSEMSAAYPDATAEIRGPLQSRPALKKYGDILYSKFYENVI